MRVHTLREILATLPDDMLVLVASDEEGNSFHPLADAETAAYDDTDSWFIEVIHPNDAEGDEPQALVLWP